MKLCVCVSMSELIFLNRVIYLFIRINQFDLEIPPSCLETIQKATIDTT